MTTVVITPTAHSAAKHNTVLRSQQLGDELGTVPICFESMRSAASAVNPRRNVNREFPPRILKYGVMDSRMEPADGWTKRTPAIHDSSQQSIVV